MQPESADWVVVRNEDINKLEWLGFSDLTFENDEFCVYPSYTVDGNTIMSLFNSGPNNERPFIFPVTIRLGFYDMKSDEWNSSEEQGIAYYVMNRERPVNSTFNG